MIHIHKTSGNYNIDYADKALLSVFIAILLINFSILLVMFIIWIFKKEKPNLLPYLGFGGLDDFFDNLGMSINSICILVAIGMAIIITLTSFILTIIQ